jgi:hypothetical protein
MIRLFSFDDGKGNEHGFEGWHPDFLHGDNVLPSTMIAHDVFDHRPGDAPTLGITPAAAYKRCMELNAAYPQG